MRHVIQRSLRIVLVMAATVICGLAPWGVTVTEAQNEALRGTYDLTFTRTCSVEVGDAGGTSIPLGGAAFGPFYLRGRITYDGSGGGSFEGQQAIPGAGTTGSGISTGPGTLQIIFTQADLSGCALSYAVGADGSVSQELNNCSLTFNFGANQGGTGTLSGVLFPGQLSLDGTVVVLSYTGINPETITFLTGPLAGQSETRICHGSGLATSKR